MSSVSKGSSRVGSVLSQLARLGYRCARISASGQRKGSRIAEKPIAGDLIGFAPADSGYPNVLVEVGGEKKSCKSAFAALHEDPLPPGFIALVARCMPNKRWRYHVRSYEHGFSSLEHALEAAE